MLPSGNASCAATSSRSGVSGVIVSGDGMRRGLGFFGSGSGAASLARSSRKRTWNRLSANCWHASASPARAALITASPSSREAAAGHGAAARPHRTIVFHGDRDNTVNPVNGDQVIAQSKAAADLRTTVTTGKGPGGIRYTCTVQMDENGRSVLEQWVLHGAGHAWSGGSTADRTPSFFLQCPPAVASR